MSPGLPATLAVVVAVLTVGGCAGSGTADERSNPSALPREAVHVTVGDTAPLRVEIADTPAERRQGLMHRERLEPGTGMLFLFPSAREGAFWMYQTRIPLSIAWAADGRVVGIAEMEPCPHSDPASCPRYPAPAAYDLAVEASAGTFTAAGVSAGDEVRIGGNLPTPTD